MSEGVENLVPTFEGLLSSLDEQLSPSQVWELDVHIRYDELESAFDLLCSMLREFGGPLPAEARSLIKTLAHGLGIDEAHWQDLGETKLQ